MIGKIELFDDDGVLMYRQQFNALDCVRATFTLNRFPIGEKLLLGFTYEPMIGEKKEHE